MKLLSIMVNQFHCACSLRAHLLILRKSHRQNHHFCFSIQNYLLNSEHLHESLAKVITLAAALISQYLIFFHQIRSSMLIFWSFAWQAAVWSMCGLIYTYINMLREGKSKYQALKLFINIDFPFWLSPLLNEN